MADKFTKKAVASADAPADSWKDIVVEKESQPAKVTQSLTYRELENRVASIDAQVKSLGDEKTALQAEMAKVKSAAES